MKNVKIIKEWCTYEGMGSAVVAEYEDLNPEEALQQYRNSISEDNKILHMNENGSNYYFFFQHEYSYRTL